MATTSNSSKKSPSACNPTTAAAPPTQLPRDRGSVYPQYPPETQVLFRTSPSELNWYDRLLVGGSSLAIVGSLIWLPTALVWSYRKWRAAESRRHKVLYGGLFWGLLALLIHPVVAPNSLHHHPIVGQGWFRVKQWRLWKAWMRYVAFEVVADRKKVVARQNGNTTSSRTTPDNSILAFVPHGIFPFSFGMGAMFHEAQEAAFGAFRPIVASAIQLFPIVNMLVSWVGGVDASRRSVHRALSTTSNNNNTPTRVGVIPGGIAEIFEGYPKAGEHPDEEYTIVRKGFLKMAMQHGRSVVPIYCFGSTHMMRRLHIPILETLSNLLRISLCIFYGAGGLPLPFRQRLLYVMGEPIDCSSVATTGTATNGRADVDGQIDVLHQQFCDSLKSLFDRHKEAYGWGHKTLKIISR